MKKFINKVENILSEMIDGIVNANPDSLERIKNSNVIKKKNINNNKVSLISGGGSGHEPAHAGFIGLGMLDAAVCGEIFTSPTPDQILTAIKETKSLKGTLLIVKNYTGDIMNFEIAKEMAESDGIEVEMVIVNDDIALENSTYTTGKRGIAGTIFVHKIAGAAAESGMCLKDVKDLAQNVIDNIGSYGISLDGCVIPSTGKKAFILKDDEVEIGLGIHGEPGVEKSSIKSADEFAKLVFDRICSYLKLKREDDVAFIINGLGATPLMELYILARKVTEISRDYGLNSIKCFVGNYMTSMDMPGFSLSIIKLNNKLKELILKPTNTIGLFV